MTAAKNRLALHQRWLRSGVVINCTVAPSLVERGGGFRLIPDNAERFDEQARKLTQFDGRTYVVKRSEGSF